MKLKKIISIFLFFSIMFSSFITPVHVHAEELPTDTPVTEDVLADSPIVEEPVIEELIVEQPVQLKLTAPQPRNLNKVMVFS